MSTSETIVAAATPTGRSALAVIRIDGPLAATIACAAFGRNTAPAARRATTAVWRDLAGNAIDQVVDEPPKRRQWGLPPEMRLDLLPPDSESSSKNNSPAGTVTSKTIRTIRAHSPSVGSEASEYLSLSEEDATSSTPPSVPIRRMRTNAAGPKLNQHPPTPSPSLDGDADDAFRAMCITLAARQRQSLIELSGSPALPSDLSQVPVETLQSMDDSDTEETDSRRPSGGGAEFWRRSSSEPVGTAITLHQLHAAIGARRSSSFDAGQSASSHTPPLTNTAFMNDYQHV